jgi:cytochrome c
MFQFRFLALGAPVAIAAALLVVSPAPAQSTNGQTLFNQRCKTCHTVSAGGASMVGPNLRGVVGRKAGAAKFAYSAAIKNSKLVWTKPVLEKYLAAPTKAVPGTKMVISVSDAAQRKAIIDFLATQR